jgi:hypothetical protein
LARPEGSGPNGSPAKTSPAPEEAEVEADTLKDAANKLFSEKKFDSGLQSFRR